MRSSIRTAWRDTRGASFVEYAILVGVVALLAIHAFTVFGTDAKTAFAGAGANVAQLGL